MYVCSWEMRSGDNNIKSLLSFALDFECIYGGTYGCEKLVVISSTSSILK